MGEILVRYVLSERTPESGDLMDKYRSYRYLNGAKEFLRYRTTTYSIFEVTYNSDNLPPRVINAKAVYD